MTPVDHRENPSKATLRSSPAAIPKQFPARVLQLQTLGLQLQLTDPAGQDVFKKSEENHGVTVESMGISVVKSKMGLHMIYIYICTYAYIYIYTYLSKSEKHFFRNKDCPESGVKWEKKQLLSIPFSRNSTIRNSMLYYIYKRK